MKKRKIRSYSSKIGKRNQRRRLFKISLLLLLPIVLMASFVFLMRLDFLQVKSVKVEGVISLDEKKIEIKIKEFLTGNYLALLPKSNILFIDSDKIESLLIKEFGKIEKISVKNSPSGDIKINIKEKEAVASWCRDEECFLVDRHGVLYARANAEETSLLVTLSGGIYGEPIFSSFAEESQINNFLTLAQSLQKISVEVEKITLESKDKAIFQTKVGDIFVLPNEEKIEEVAENILLLIEAEREKNPKVFFEYIDMRFGNKLFYKTL